MDKNITIETAPIFDDQCVTGAYASDLVGSALTKPAVRFLSNFKFSSEIY